MNAITDRPPPYTSLKRTLTLRRESRAERARLALLNPYPDGVQRPQTRADCLEGGSNAQRPCPFVACRYHMLIDIARHDSVTLHFGHDDPDRLAETCALDIADEGGKTLQEVGELMGVTRERIRQIQERALQRAGAICVARGAKENW